MEGSVRKKWVVLAADDDENAHILLKRAFAKARLQAELHTVNNGLEAISYFRGDGKYGNREEFPLPDLLLLDLKMPVLSGFEVLEAVKKDLRLDGLRVLILSSSNSPKDIQRAQELGCDGYFVKPNRFDKLVEMVAAFEADFPTASEPNPSAKSQGNSALKKGAPTAQNQGPPDSESVTKPMDEVLPLLVAQIRDYAIFVLDPMGRIRTWNEGARRLIGYESHEVLGKHFSIFCTPSDLEAEKPQFELRMASDTGRYEDEGWRIRKDGSRFWANVIVTALHDGDGKLVGFAKITRDLTQRKLQEDGLQRLLETEERFRLLVEQVKDYAIFILDARGNVVSWNQGARRIKGYTADEIIGKHFSVFYTPEDLARDHPSQELTQAVQEGRFEEEGWRVRKDGTHFWASVVITSIWDKRGNLSGFAKVTRDLTARKKEEEALRQRTRDLESFAHTLSHDLRAPLRSISSFSQILQSESDELSESERREYVGKIVRAAGSMESLIDDILTYSRLSLASMVTEQVPLDEVIQECIALLESEVTSRHAEISIQKPLPVIKGSRTLLLQIFSNLLGNALKFIPKDTPPRISISAEYETGFCRIHVKDNGIGISEQHRERIFQVFERVPTKTPTSGSGIGLAIVKTAAERHGGSVTVESQEGHGSDFIVRLPCEVPRAIPQERR